MNQQNRPEPSEPSKPVLLQRLEVSFDWLCNHIFALGLIAIGVFILGLASFWLVQSFGSFGPSILVGDTFNVLAPPVGSSNSVTTSFDCQEDCAIVTLRLQHLDPSTRRIKGVLQVQAMPSLLENLWSNFEYLAPPDPDNDDKRALKTKFQDLEASLKFFDLSGSGVDPEIGIALGTLFPESPYTAPLLSYPIELLAIGDPTQYPSDWYFSDYAVYLELPNGVSIFKNGFRFHIPIELRVQSDIGMAGKTVQVEIQNESPDSATYSLSFLVVRDRTLVVFVYLMSCLPIILGVVFAHMLFWNTKSKRERLHVFLLDAIAVMLAVMPLRAVLVPSELQGFLRIDFVLAFGLAFIVSITVIKYGVEIWQDATKTQPLPDIPEPEHPIMPDPPTSQDLPKA